MVFFSETPTLAGNWITVINERSMWTPFEGLRTKLLLTTFYDFLTRHFKKPVKSHVFWNVKNTKNTYPRTLTHAGCLPRNRRSAPALSLWNEVQIVCIWSHWCHCHPKTPSSLASFKSTLVLPFWYRLTQVVLEKTPLNGCSVYSKVR